jgi:hypothetical protein
MKPLRPAPLDYTSRRRNASPALERRDKLVREAAGMYIKVLAGAAVATVVLALLIMLWLEC